MKKVICLYRVSTVGQVDHDDIVINAFTEPFVMPMELLDIIAEMDSAIENPENE